MYGIVIALAATLVGLAWAVYQYVALHSDARRDPPVEPPALDVFENETTWIPTNRGRVRRRDLPDVKVEKEPTVAIYGGDFT